MRGNAVVDVTRTRDGVLLGFGAFLGRILGWFGRWRKRFLLELVEGLGKRANQATGSARLGAERPARAQQIAQRFKAFGEQVEPHFEGCSVMTCGITTF